MNVITSNNVQEYWRYESGNITQLPEVHVRLLAHFRMVFLQKCYAFVLREVVM